MSDDNTRKITQTPEYLGGYLDATKDRERTEAREAQAKSEEEAGIIRTPNGVFRHSDDSGIMITVTQRDDPAYALLQDGYTTTPRVYRTGCYICEDPEFARMGLPLCRPCPQCTGDGPEPKGHIAADDVVCDECGFDSLAAWEEEQATRGED